MTLKSDSSLKSALFCFSGLEDAMFPFVLRVLTVKYLFACEPFEVLVGPEYGMTRNEDCGTTL